MVIAQAVSKESASHFAFYVEVEGMDEEEPVKTDWNLLTRFCWQFLRKSHPPWRTSPQISSPMKVITALLEANGMVVRAFENSQNGSFYSLNLPNHSFDSANHALKFHPGVKIPLRKVIKEWDVLHCQTFLKQNRSHSQFFSSMADVFRGFLNTWIGEAGTSVNNNNANEQCFACFVMNNCQIVIKFIILVKILVAVVATVRLCVVSFVLHRR